MTSVVIFAIILTMEKHIKTKKRNDFARSAALLGATQDAREAFTLRLIRDPSNPKDRALKIEADDMVLTAMQEYRAVRERPIK